MSIFKDIPTTFPDAQPQGLKRDLERFSNSVIAFGKDAGQRFGARISPLAKTADALSFDLAVPFNLLAGQTVSVPLPRPDPKNGGLSCWLVRKSPLGTLVVRAIGCTVDGAASYTVPSAAGTTQFFFDGSNYWTNRSTGGAGSGDVTGPTGATDLDIAIYDGTTGKLIKDSGTTIASIIAQIPLGGGVPVNVTKAPASAGTSGTWSNSDHKHDVSTAVVGTVNLSGVAAAEGVATTLARSDHTHSLTGSLGFSGLAPIAPNSLLGRWQAGTGTVQPLSVASTISILSGIAGRAAIIGDVSIPLGSNIAAISGLSLTKLQTIQTRAFVGRGSAGTGTLEILTSAGGVGWSGTTFFREALTGDVTAPDGSNVTTITGLILPKLQSIQSGVLMGRGSPLTGTIELLTAAGGVGISGTTFYREALTGDVTAPAGSNVTTITTLPVTKLQSIQTSSILGRGDPLTGTVEVLTSAGGIGFSGTTFFRQALTGDVTAPDGSNVTTIAGLTLPKLQSIRTSSLLGRGDPLTGTVEVLTSAGGIGFSGTTFYREALTGDVTAPAGSNVTTLASVPLAKLPAAPPQSVLGNGSAATNTYGPIQLGTNGQVLLRRNNVVSGGFVLDENVASNAAVAGTKINPDFGSQNVITTGNYLAGTNPASAGTIRLPAQATIQARGFSGTSDFILLQSDTVDRVTLGDACPNVFVKASGGIALEITSAVTEFKQNLVRFVRTAVAPVLNIEPSSVAGASGTSLELAGQDMNGTGATRGGITFVRGGTGKEGGQLQLLSGTGSSGIHGDWNGLLGNQRILFWAGNTPKVAAGGNIRFPMGGQINTRNASDTGDLGVIRSNSSDFFFIAENSTGAAICDTKLIIGGSIEIGVNDFHFDQAMTNPFIYQEADSTSGVTGQRMFVQAQSTPGTGSTIGGQLNLRGGDSTNGTGGGISMRSGTGSSSIKAGDFTVSVGNSAILNWAGADPVATAGTLRLPATGSMFFRNAANSANLCAVRTDASDNFYLGEGGVVTTINDGTGDINYKASAANGHRFFVAGVQCFRYVGNAAGGLIFDQTYDNISAFNSTSAVHVTSSGGRANVGLASESTTPSFGGGKGILHIGDCTAVPTGTGNLLFENLSNLKHIGTLPGIWTMAPDSRWSKTFVSDDTRGTGTTGLNQVIAILDTSTLGTNVAGTVVAKVFVQDATNALETTDIQMSFARNGGNLLVGGSGTYFAGASTVGSAAFGYSGTSNLFVKYSPKTTTAKTYKVLAEFTFASKT